MTGYAQGHYLVEASSPRSVKDADTVDGIQAASFLRSDVSDTASGSINFTNSYYAFGNSTGSVSNDANWNARVNIAGSSHARFDVKSVSDGIITTMYSHTGHNRGKIGTMSNHALGLMVNCSEKATLDSSGNFTATGDVTAYSDARLKSDVVTIEGALDKVSAMRGVMYTKDGVASTGVIAQEVEEVLPEVVHTADDDMETKSVAYGNMAGMFIEAIKELKAELEAVKADNAELRKLLDK